ncbi:energy-coupling factor ABC transporter ATP-binding protein [Amaricoccus sp. B4]|uniref:energy-coupling factor ABC transporter ATP-binding protein n=1 Tax=Amaricoccus sp. B4 TaxID=3368557 RepID=UPI003720E4D1
MARNMNAEVRLEGVSLAKGGRAIFEGLTLALSERRIGLVGRNGSGKSQLARLVCGLVLPDAGTVRVAGVDVGRDRRRAIDTVGILFQNPDHQIIFPTVEEEIAFGLSQQGRGRRDAQAGARDILARFGRADWAERPVQTLSQGQRHLVCLMAVIAMAPRLVVLDEPFAGLDLPTTMRLSRHLDGLEAAVLHISHDLAALEGYERVIWLEGGRIAADGPPEAVLPAYRSEMERLGGADDLADL